MNRYDVAIIGGGFAGSILARTLVAQGRRVVLFDRETHPRFALGESTTPLANFALERLARRYDLPDLHQLATHGRWMEHHPGLRRGLKRGFTFYRHRPEETFSNSSANEHRLLVAASPEDRLADTHWLRQDVDHFLLERARDEGVEVHEATEIVAVEPTDGDWQRGHGQRAQTGQRLITSTGDSWTVDAVVDGSGPSGVMSRSQGLKRVDLPFDTALLFCHLRTEHPAAPLAEAATDAVLPPGPYPDPRAAVHHLLAEGWIYELPFDHGLVSVGAVLRRDAAEDLLDTARRDPEAAWGQLMSRYPSLERHFAATTSDRPWAYVERLAYRLDRPMGRGWFLLPHTFGFCDPLFSTGIAWSLAAVERLAVMLTDPHSDPRLYERCLQAEMRQIEALIDAAYTAMDDFDLFVDVCRLYFVTVSFAEASQRLQDPATVPPTQVWEGLLGATDGRFRRLFEKTRSQIHDMMEHGQPSSDARDAFHTWLFERLELFDIAGFGDTTRRNLYPVDLDILVERAHLLGLSQREIQAALPRLLGEA